ncbi:hypothetical protein ASD99_24465 [Mesorhizobium sp. Root695]|nr:hypothetical protein ASD99_24465 [Mesorhizobium sp. Root695]
MGGNVCSDDRPFGIGYAAWISKLIAAILPPSVAGPHGLSEVGISNPLESADPAILNMEVRSHAASTFLVG